MRAPDLIMMRDENATPRLAEDAGHNLARARSPPAVRLSVSPSDVSDPILGATDAADEVYDNPSEDALDTFMEDLRAAGRAAGQSFRIERLEEGREGESGQVALNEHGLYVFDSSETLHYVSSLQRSTTSSPAGRSTCSTSSSPGARCSGVTRERSRS
jgi:hypothetical protein